MARESEDLVKLAHQVRTPLASVRLMAEMLTQDESGTLTARDLKYAHNIHLCALEIQALITSALTKPATNADASVSTPQDLPDSL